MSRFLEPADVERLTGRKLPSKQLEYCRDNGIRAWLSARNEVIIPLTAIDGKPTATNDSTWTPDFSSIQRGG